MAITTLDGIINGFQLPQSLMKVGVTMEAAGVGHSTWYMAGRPGAGAAPAPGINGAAVTGNAVAGQIPRANPGAGNAHVGRLAIQASQQGTLWLCDRLWHNSALSTTLTTAQAITPAAIPARDRDGTTNGEDVLAAIEWSAAGGAGTPTVTLTYTNQAGTAGKTGTFVASATPVAGTFEVFSLAAGDTGVRAPTSFIQSATRTSGSMHLILFRLLAVVPVTTANVANPQDGLQLGLPRLYNDSVPFMVWWPISTTAANISGQYIETHG